MSTARGALSVVGQAVGAYFGGPIGAAAGGIIGGEIGGLIDGPPEGPRLDDLSAPQIQYGGKIPRFYGGPRWFEIAPLWMTEKREDSETVGGKGGDSGVEQFSYRIDMLVRVCESREGTPCEVIAVTGVEVDGQLVWTSLADASAESIAASAEQEIWADMAVQLGHEDQAPWSVYEAAEGTANANAYRGYLTVGFQDFLLGHLGAPRRVRIQAITAGTGAASRIFDYSGADEDYVVPAGVTSLSVFLFGGDGLGGGAGGYTTDTIAVTPGETLTIRVGGMGTTGTAFGGGALNGGAGASSIRRGGTFVSVAGGGGGGAVDGDGNVLLGGAGGGTVGGGGETSAGTPAEGGTQVGGGLGGTIPGPGGGAGSDGDDGGIGNGGGPGNQTGAAMAGGGGGGYHGGGGGGTTDDEAGAGGGGSGHAESGTTTAGGGQDSPFYPGTGHGRVVIGGGWTPGTVDLRDILEYEAERCAPLTAANIDFSAAEGIPVECHVAIGSAADAMQPLLTRFWFDVYGQDKLYLVRRGGEVEQTVSYRWTGSGAGGRSESFAGLKRSNDVEVGRKKAITYSNVLADGEADTRTGDRESISSDVDTLSMNLNMRPSEAQGLADTATADARVAGHTATVRLGARSGLLLQPGSVLEFVDHKGNTYRTLARRVVWDRWVWECEIRLDDPAVLQAAGIAVDLDQRALTVAPPPEATLYVLDIPLLRQQDDGPGEYVAVTQTGRNRGVDIYKSSDDVTYAQIGERLTTRATAGVCDSVLPPHDGWAWDNASVLTVTLDDGSGGTLSSATKEAIEASRALNLAAVGAHGRWELVQFATATLVTGSTYELSGFLRNLLGTEWANGDHAADDSFVLLQSSGLARVPGSIADLGQTRYYKAVPAGRSVSQTVAVSIVCEEQGLLPYAPLDIVASRALNGDATISWNRRSRYEGLSTEQPPLGEASESYTVLVYNSSFTTALRTLSSSSASVQYTLAQQQADYGGTPSVIYVRVRQHGAEVGPGHPTDATLSLGSAIFVPLSSGSRPDVRVAADDRALVSRNGSTAMGLYSYVEDGSLGFLGSVSMSGIYAQKLHVEASNQANGDWVMYLRAIGNGSSDRKLLRGNLVSGSFAQVSPAWMPADPPFAIGYHDSKFILLTVGGTVYHSSDGASWTSQGSLSGLSLPPSAASFATGRMMTVGGTLVMVYALGVYYADDDGLTWSAATGDIDTDAASYPDTFAALGGATTGALGGVVVRGRNGATWTALYYTSADGQSWTQQATGAVSDTNIDEDSDAPIRELAGAFYAYDFWATPDPGREHRTVGTFGGVTLYSLPLMLLNNRALSDRILQISLSDTVQTNDGDIVTETIAWP